MNRSAEIASKLDAIRTELADLQAVEQPTDEQAARAAELVADYETTRPLFEAALEYEAKRDAILADVTAGRVERAVPEVIVKRDEAPYDDVRAIARGWLPDGDMIARAATTIERCTVRGVSDEARQRATVLAESDPTIARHILLTGNPAYGEAFQTILRHGPTVGLAMLSDEQRDAVRAALSNTDANGGYSNPWYVDPTIILTNDGIAGPIRSISRVVTGTTELWNGLTSSGVTAEWLGEGSEAADKTPTVGQPSIGTVKGAAYVFASYEQEVDGQVVAQLPRLIQDAKVRLEEAAFATGAGSTTAPKGVVTAVAAVTASRVSPTTSGTFSAASEVYKVANAVPARHAANVTWLANKTTINTIRQFGTAVGASFLADLAMGQPPQLLGQPLRECSTMTATVTTGSNLLLAGDFSEFLIYDRVGTTMRYDPIVVGSNQRPTGQSGWFAFWRTGSDVTNVNAFRLLQL